MRETVEIADGDFEAEVVRAMRSVEGPASLELLVDETGIPDRETAKTVMRSLINDGKVSTTPDWNFKLATRLRQ